MSRITDEEWGNTMDRLIRLLRHLQRAYYYSDEPLVSDAEFDELFRSLQAMENTRPHLARADSPTQGVAPPAGV